jgi:transposase
MQEALTKYNIPWEPNELKPTLQYKLMKYVRENIEPEVVQMAKAAGHEILYSPPNLSYLSPIETVWANIKGYIG